MYNRVVQESSVDPLSLVTMTATIKAEGSDGKIYNLLNRRQYKYTDVEFFEIDHVCPLNCQGQKYVGKIHYKVSISNSSDVYVWVPSLFCLRIDKVWRDVDQDLCLRQFRKRVLPKDYISAVKDVYGIDLEKMKEIEYEGEKWYQANKHKANERNDIKWAVYRPRD